jgi:8-oxo-dGTP pyrophosphatase MutT (NUDIX family)
MNLRFEKEGDFREFKEELGKRLDVRETRNVENPGFKRSAVKVLLLEKDGAPHVLLTKRSDKVATHKGQISFPGGGFDEKDGEIINTAFRETFEETGIRREDIEYIGRFDDYVSIFGFHVSCFVGAIAHPYEYSFNEGEIDDYVEAPLSIFVNRQYDHVDYYNHEGRDYKIYHYLYGGFEIWGLTARILTDFATEVVAD